MKTRNGIYHNLNESTYTGMILYPNNIELIFTFSSLLYLNKFLMKRKNERKIMQYYFHKKYGVNIDTGMLSDILLYAKIEKRGFLIKEIKNSRMKNYKCLEAFRFDILDLT